MKTVVILTLLATLSLNARAMENPRLQPVSKILGAHGVKAPEPPTHLIVKDHETKKTETISATEFGKRAGFQWIEENLVDPSKVEEIKTLMHDHVKYPTNGRTELETKYRQISQNMNKLEIHRINKDIGYAVFANADIAAGTYIATYSGLLVPKSELLERKVDFVYSASFASDDTGPIGTIDAKEYRNMCALFMHVPENNTFYKVDEPYKLATQNVSGEFVSYMGLPILLFKAARKIKSGEMLGWDYGKLYWEHMPFPPALFTPEGEVIPVNKYHAQVLTLLISANKIPNPVSLTAEISLKELNGTLDANKGYFVATADPAPYILGITRNDFEAVFKPAAHAPLLRVNASFVFNRLSSKFEYFTEQAKAVLVGSGHFKESHFKK